MALPISSSLRLLEAINFATVKHKDQRRKDPEGTPYINHPIGVAYILSKEGGIEDIDTIIAAVLHDTVEDTNTTLQEVELLFGSKVKTIVEECSDDKTLPKEERKRLQIVHSKTSSYEAKLVKLADKLYNLRDLKRAKPIGWTDERIREYFVWAYKVVQGLKGTNGKLEEALHAIFVRENVTSEAKLGVDLHSQSSI